LTARLSSTGPSRPHATATFRGIRCRTSPSTSSDEVVAFLDASAEEAGRAKFVWGEGDDDVALFEEGLPRPRPGSSWPRSGGRASTAGLGHITGAAEFGGELPGA
jgi:hypothetical protein